MDTAQRLKTLKFRVEYILQGWPETRNDDVELTRQLWRVYFPGWIIKHSDGTEYIALTSLSKIPREDNIKRVRAYWQNTRGLYLPTTWEVAKKRQISETEWRDAMRNN